MKKALITGSSGFVGGYLRQELLANGYEVIGLDVQEAEQTIKADLLNAEQTKAVIERVKPDCIFHLAGQANVARSWKIPQKTVEINVVGAVNLMEAVRNCCPNAHMVLVGSSDQYRCAWRGRKVGQRDYSAVSSNPVCCIKAGTRRNGTSFCACVWIEYMYDPLV